MRDRLLPTEGTRSLVEPGTDGADEEYGTGRVDGGSLVADGGVPLSEFLEAIADERRRYVLYYLREEGRAELDEVIEQLAEWETAASDDPDDRTRRNLRINLHHGQLPKLEEAGLIGYDRRYGSMRYREPPDRIETFLDYCADIESPGTTE